MQKNQPNNPKPRNLTPPKYLPNNLIKKYNPNKAPTNKNLPK